MEKKRKRTDVYSCPRVKKKSFAVSRTNCKGIGRHYSSDRIFACVRWWTSTRHRAMNSPNYRTSRRKCKHIHSHIYIYTSTSFFFLFFFSIDVWTTEKKAIIFFILIENKIAWLFYKIISINLIKWVSIEMSNV